MPPRYAVPMLLATAILLTYANGWNVGFHFDDWHVIEHNLAIRSWRNLAGFFFDPTFGSASPDNRTLRPLLLATFAFNYAVSGLAPWSYHGINLLLHFLATVLVYRIVRDHLWLGRAALPIATLASVLMAVHPLNTSAVDYVSARSALMATVWYLAAFDAALRQRVARAMLLLAGSLLTKEIGVSFPVVVLAYWGIAGERPRWTALGGYALIVAASLVYRGVLLPPTVFSAMHGDDVTSWIYCMTGWSAYLYYLRLFVWPDRLVVDRLDYPVVRSFAEPQAWASLLALVVLGLLAWRARRRLPAVTFAAAWVWLTLAPESSIFPLAEPVNEHRPYLAMLGLCVLAALALWHGARFVARSLAVSAQASFAGVGASVVVMLATTAYARTTLWQSDYALWLDATEKAPNNTRAWMNAGHAAMALGDSANAERLLLQSQRLAPCYGYALLNLSALTRGAGRLEEAQRWADRAVECAPGFALAHHYRAAAFAASGHTDEAAAEYREATVLNPRYLDAWNALAEILETQNEWADAAMAWDQVHALDPTRSDAAVRASVVYRLRLGKPELAVARAESALRADPAHYGAHYQLAVSLLAAGRTDDAQQAWKAFVPLAHAVKDQAILDAAPAALQATPSEMAHS